ncbi:lysosomal alpha-mannosidase-like [Antedon mediterranea]|uniref:lysosomal alpha-mannosidase-like n=1 Tax=Antedon mediterranea TaxID=105859 RepID=UPI003AF817BA
MDRRNVVRSFYFTFLNVVFQLPSVLTLCGYDACNPTISDPYVLNVHLVPHTHDDVGWLKTVDQYYMGSKNQIQHAGVQYILDSVVSELLKDPKKRFIYVEIAFFARWWHEQDDEMKLNVKKLVNEGRLEFINGGWCMNDEASTHYNSIIDQMTIGLRFLNDTFGSCGRPLVAWHIDPFGHSREQASIFAQMSFDGFFFARLDYADKKHRMIQKEMEAIWHGSSSLGNTADLLFGALYAHYNPPPGFCYDQFCNDPPIQDDQDLYDYNVDEQVKKFIAYAKMQSLSFKTNHIMMTMGSDFQYENAIPWFKNMDKLISYVNQKGNEFKINVLYSTPSCYVKSLNEAGKTWPTKSDDFFPYADQPHSYWTGYFSSRPALKYYERVSNNLLQICKQLEVLAGNRQINITSESKTLKRAMAVAQHHDAVSGTEKQHVADDYAKRLAIGSSHCQNLVNVSLGSFLSATSPPSFTFCTLLNISVCPVTEDSKSFAVVVYNPIGRVVTQFVRFPVNGDNFLVEGPDGNPITSIISIVSASTKAVRRSRGTATHELVFMATVPALGYNTYMVYRAKFTQKFQEMVFSKPMREKALSTSPIVIENEFLKITFDNNTGLLDTVIDTVSNLTMMVKQTFLWYNSSTGTPDSSQASGAYIFRPNRTNPIPIMLRNNVLTKVYQSNLIQEVHQEFSPWLTQVVRLYKAQRHAEFEWTVGPIPFQDGFGKEIITRFDSDIKSGKQFFTDSNGREILERVKDHRDTWFYNVTEPVSGNYYPVNSRIYIKDDKKQMTILTDRSQGGSSLQEGSIELMIHRRIQHDDGRGVGEPLNETGQFGDGLIIRGKHFVLLSSPAKSASLHRNLAEQLYMAPSISFFKASADWQIKYNLSGSFLHKNLPANVHLLTLELWDSNTALIRLEHQYEKDEDPDLSTNVTVSFKNLFVSFDVLSVREVSLSANQFAEDATRLKWKVMDSDQMMPSNKKPIPVSPKTLNVLLSPMQIRSFLATIKGH